MMYFNENKTLLNLKGEEVERTPFDYPYSYDQFLVWIGNYNEKDHIVYSDRMYQWDAEKYDQCCEKIWKNRGQYFDNRKHEDIERFLSEYFNKKIELTAIEQACNKGNGYPYWIFYFKEDVL